MPTEYDPAYQDQLKRLTAAHKNALRDYEKAQRHFDGFLRSRTGHKEIKLQHERAKLALCKDKFELLNGQLNYMRPSSNEDIAYRARQSREFADWVSELVPDDLPLRFYGCPIYEAERIFGRGEIVSREDRLGISYPDHASQIPVATKDNLYSTGLGNADMDRYTLPAGCIFVLTPADSEDESRGKFREMDSVNFRNSPDRLVAVISTPENMPRIQNWLRQADIPIQKAVDFDGFVCNMDYFIDSVCIPYQDRPMKTPLWESMTPPDEKPRLDALLKSATSRASEAQISDHTHIKTPMPYER